MAEAATLTAKPRKELGSRAVGRLRRAGQLPAVLYGHKEAILSLTVKNEDMGRIVRHGQRVVDLKLDGGKVEKCFIKEVQWDAIGKEIVHVDFTRISLDERIRVTVPVVTKGTAAGQATGGVIDQPMHTIEVECLAISVPDAIRVTIQELQIDQAIHLKELVLPEGVKAFGDPEAVVVQCIKPIIEEIAPTPAEGAAVPGAAEPEVIGRKVAAEEGEAAEAPAAGGKKEAPAKKEK
jgi:large subunit ribosomal protein L25